MDMSFDLSDLDLADMGSWPKVVKALCLQPSSPRFFSHPDTSLP